MYPISFVDKVLNFEVTDHKCCFILSVSMVWLIYCCIFFGVLCVIHSIRQTYQLERAVQQSQDKQKELLNTDSDSDESDSDTQNCQKLKEEIVCLNRTVNNLRRGINKPRSTKATQTISE